MRGGYVMNIQKFTQKSLEAVNSLQKITIDHGNQEIAQMHLLYALMTQEDGILPRLIEKMEINLEHFTGNVEDHINRRPKVSGGNPFVGEKLNKVLIKAEDEAKSICSFACSNIPTMTSRNCLKNTV